MCALESTRQLSCVLHSAEISNTTTAHYSITVLTQADSGQGGHCGSYTICRSSEVKGAEQEEYFSK